MMLKFNFIYELKQLLRSRWLQLLSIFLLLLFGLATYNGLQKVKERNTSIAAVKAEVNEGDAIMVKVLDSLESGQEVALQRWYWPSNPMVVGNNYPRVAAMPADDFTFIATGQSDMFTHYKKPQVSRGGLVEDFTEMTSPVQLLFGSFDLAFVIIYLLPLLIIAFSYNVLSAEKESGSLRLLAAQPIRIEYWVLQKLGLRFFWLTVLVISTMIFIFIVLGIRPFGQATTFLDLISLTLAYMLFWFALAFLVNLWVGSSAKNAVSLLGLWIVFVLLLPSVLNQVGTSLYPMPSRALMINEMRGLQADATKRQDEILDNFLRDHPEYAVNDTTQQRNFWHGYIASQNLVRTKLQPVLDDYDAQLQKQQDWITQFKWLSPAIITQESLNAMAGTSTRDYENFRKQVIAFSKEWRQHLYPFVYNNKEFTKANVKNLPDFKHKPLQRASLSPLIILLISAAVFSIGFLIAKKKKANLILN